MKSKTKNKIFRTTTAVLMFIVLASMVFASSTYRGSSALISMTRFEPSPVEPGSYAQVWLKVQNVGDRDMPNFRFRLIPEFPFSLDANEDPLRSLGELSPGEQVTISYKIRVDENAVEGDNALGFEFSDGGSWQDAKLTVPIRTLDAIISISDITTIPKMVEPGQPTEITLSLKNNADSDLRQVNLQIGLINYLTSAAGTTIVELPFTPRKSNEQTVYSLKGGEERDVKFEFIVDPDAESKPYKLPLSLNYIDSVGVNYSKAYIIGLVVGGEPDLDVSIEETTIRKIKSPGRITLKIVNKGVTDAKFMNVKMEDNGNYKVVSSESFYIGNVDSDDFESAEFTIIPLKKDGGVVTIPVKLEYKDANNNDYEETVSIELDIAKAKAMNPRGGGGGTILFAIIIIVGGYFFYRRWAKKKKEKEKKKP